MSASARSASGSEDGRSAGWPDRSGGHGQGARRPGGGADPVVDRAPVQVRGEVLNRRRVGAYHLLEVAAGGIAERARPGQFVAVSVGGRLSSLLLRRAFALYRATPTGA